MYEQELKVVIEAVREAGELLRTEFHRPGGARGHSSHAEADEKAEWQIRKRLLTAFPDYRYRGEETGSLTSENPHVWLVDPNDGTSSYLRGGRGSAVSVALIRSGVPVVGAVYAFVAPDDRGDFIYWAEGSDLIRNGQPVKTNWNVSQKKYAVLLVSLHRENMIPEVLECIGPYRYIAYPSIAYRLALAAVGDGHVAVSWHNPADWDYAAGHALIKGAGGIFVDETGDEITYSANGESKARRCFGGDPQIVRDLLGRDWERVQTAHTKTAEFIPRSLYMFSRPQPGKSVTNYEILSRAKGCFLGQCAGDALGQQVEFEAAATIRKKYPEGIRTMEDGGTWNAMAGQITDDSELALLLARSIVSTGKYDIEKVAQAYYYWFHETEPYDIGNTIRRALSAPNSSASTMVAAANQESQANGSLMRISPLGLYGYRMKVEDLWQLACKESELTHPHEICQQSCALYVCAISDAIRYGKSSRDLYEAVVKLAEKQHINPILMDALKSAKTSLPDMQRHAGWVINAFQNAFYQLLHAPSIEEAIVNSVMQGGDTDTNAAIAGALVGAVYGRDSIPVSWRQSVLSCKPHSVIGAAHPRPLCLWPSDLGILTEQLMICGQRAG
jgi:ADP-ribosyl-[dinitrogen reductase] hydrolase